MANTRLAMATVFCNGPPPTTFAQASIGADQVVEVAGLAVGANTAAHTSHTLDAGGDPTG
jgi:hypothetical protein